MSNRITIPKSVKGLTERLVDLDGLVTSKEWERAAIVAACTEAKQGQRNNLDGNPTKLLPMSITEFAKLGIHGLTTRETIQRYRSAWETTKIEVAPGQAVTLPTADFPVSERVAPSIRDERREALVNQAEKDGIGSSKVLDVAQNPKAMAAAIKADPKVAAAATQALADSGQATVTPEVVAEAIKVNPAIRKQAAKTENEVFVAENRARLAREAETARQRKQAEDDMQISSSTDPAVDIQPSVDNATNGAAGLRITNYLGATERDLLDMVETVGYLSDDYKEIVRSQCGMVAEALRQVMVAAGDEAKSIDLALNQILQEG